MAEVIEPKPNSDPKCRAAGKLNGRVVAALGGGPLRTLRGLRILRYVPDEHFVDTLEDARTLARTLLTDALDKGT